LGVIGLVIGGIWAAASSVMEANRWKQTEEGWLYYIDVIATKFPASLMSSGPIAVDL